MKRKTYKVDEEKQILIYEEEYNNEGHLIYLKDYQADPHSEKVTKFNSRGLIEEETEFINGEEYDKLCVKYDDEGDTIEQKHYISRELYESITTIKTEQGFERITFLDGIEVEKMIHTFLDGKNYKNEFYINEELTETQVYEQDSYEKLEKTTMYNENGDIFRVRKEKFDHDDRIIESKEFNGDDYLLEEFITEYKGDLIVKETRREFEVSSLEHHTTYIYDENDNEIKREVRDPSGKIIEFFFSEYDNQNRIISERGYSIGSFNTIYGTYFNNSEFNIVHKYED